jgi:predicted esterase
MCHGDIDPVVQFNWAKQSKDKLETLGVKNLEFRVYPGMEHSACIEELQDIKRWLSRVLSKEGKSEL